VFNSFFLSLREAKIPATIREYLMLLAAMEKDVADHNIEQFYYLARACLVKDERNLDKFDRVFGNYFKGLENTIDDPLTADIPEEWLRSLAERVLTPEEQAEIEALGGWDTLMDKLRERLAEQTKRHEGGSKAIGTGGTSPFGANGYNPEGIRMGQEKSRHGRAVKVWDKREYQNLDDSREIGTRNIKVALRRLRRFAREGAETELDIPDTIRATADNGGLLDLKLVAERRNTVKVLLLLDVGGSMNPHVRQCEELFSAARTEFKHLEYYYFHNCPYERLWKDNRRRHDEILPSWEVLHTYPADYKLIFVGDATMSPYEVTQAGGSVEHWNEEPGTLWMRRFLDTYSSAVWLNPVAPKWWDSTPSIQILRRQMGDRMYPLTIDGLDRGMRELSR
jgi:uncharacterized protein with von Willebrand factor type A (vWA) domain